MRLRDAGLLSVVEDGGGLLGYRFAGMLHEVFEEMDRMLVRLCAEDLPTVPHAGPVLLERVVLDRIGFCDNPVPGSSARPPQRRIRQFQQLRQFWQRWKRRA